MAFAAFLPLIETAVGGIISLFGKNSEIDKAQKEVDLAKQNLLIATEATKQSKDKVTIAALELAQKREETAQKKLEEHSKEIRQKQSIGTITLGIIGVLIFGLGWLFVKFVLPLFSSKPTMQVNTMPLQN
jgi:phosphate starvation-inducible protein PhoH